MDYKDATLEFVDGASTVVPVRELFANVRSPDTINNNINNFFVHTDADKTVSGMTTYLTDTFEWEEYGPNTNQIKNFTIVELDDGTYKGKILLLTNPEGDLEYLVRVKIADVDSFYVGPGATEAPGDSIETGQYYWIKVENLFSVNAKNSDISKYFNEEFTGSDQAAQASAESKVNSEVFDQAGWNSKPPGTIYKSQDNSRIYVVVDSEKEAIKDSGELEDLKVKAKKSAADLIVKNYRLVMSSPRVQDLADKSISVTDQIIENRPNSTLKFLLFIPSSIIDPLLEDQEGLYEQEIKLPIVDYFDMIMKASIFLKALDFKVKEEKIPLDLKKEGTRLEKAGIAIKNHVSKYYAPYVNDSKYTLILSYDLERTLSAIMVSGPEGRVDPPTSLKREFLISATWFSEEFYKHRTFHYLANVKSMLDDKEEVGQIAGMTWIQYVQKYTLNMPEYKAAKKEKPATKKEKAEQVLQTTKDDLKGVTNNSELENVFRRLSPEIRALTFQAKKQMFQKFQDSTMSKITSKNFGVYDIDGLFTEVLDRISIDTLITTIKLAQNPDRAKSHFKEKFFIYDMEAEVQKIKRTKKELERQIEQQKKSPGSKTSAYDDNIKIKSVAKNAAKEAMDHLSALAQEALIQTVKNLLQSLIDSLKEEEESTKTQDFGSVDIENNVSPNELTAALGTVNSLRGVDFELPDLKVILKIISDNTTPMEMLAIFEGEGNMSVIQLLNRLFKKRFPLLKTLMPTLYDVEDFLIALGQNLVTSLTNAVAQFEIDKVKNSSTIDFCSSDEQIILDYLSDRFPSELAQQQADKSLVNKTALLNVLEELQQSIDGLAGLLGNDNIDAILDSIADNDAIKYNMGQVIEAYFNPIAKMFTFEALNAGESLVETITVINPEYSQKELNAKLEGKSDAEKKDIASQYIAARPPGTKEELILPLRELRELLKNPETTIYSNNDPYLNDTYVLSDPLETNFIIVLPLDTTDIPEIQDGEVSKGSSYISIEFLSIKPPPVFEDIADDAAQSKEDEESAIPQEAAEKSAAEKLDELLEEYEQTYRDIHTKFKIIMDGITIVETETVFNTLALEDPKINMGDLIDPQDIGFLPQASALKTWIDGVFKKYNAKYTDGDNTPAFNVGTTAANADDSYLDTTFTDYVHYLKTLTMKWMFPYMNRQLLERICKQISQSDFFNPDVLKKLRLTSPGAFFTSATGKQISAQDVNELVSLRNLKPRVAEKEKLFRFYEKQTSEVLFERTPLENAISMEAVETLVRIYIIEYMLSTIAVQGEVDTTKINKNLDNLQPIIGLLIENIKSFGKEYEILLTDLMLQYSQFRQEFSGRSAKVPPLPENFNVYEDDLQNILSVLINEQYDLVHEDFVAIVSLFDPSSTDVRVETKEFLDIIPNIDVAESSRSSRNRLLNPIDNLLKETVDFGGFMLERYLKIDSPPKKFGDAGATQEDVELYKMMVEDPLSSHIILVEDIANPGNFLPVRKSQVWNNPAAVKKLKKAQLWFDSYNDRYKKYSAEWAAAKAADNLTLIQAAKNKWNSWKSSYLEDYEDGNLDADYNAFISKTSPLSEQDFYYDKGNLIGVVRRSSFQELIQKIQDYHTSIIGPFEANLMAAYSDQYELDALKSMKNDTYKTYLEATSKLSNWFKIYTEKYKVAFDTSPFADFNISENEDIIFKEKDFWSKSTTTQINTFKVDVFFKLFDSNGNKLSDGYNALQEGLASWTLDTYISPGADMDDYNWRPAAEAKMIQFLNTNEAWDEFLVYLLTYNAGAYPSNIVSPFIQAFEVLVDPAGSDPEFLDSIVGQTVTGDGDYTLTEDNNDFNFSLTAADQAFLISTSDYDNLPYIKAMNDLDSLIKQMNNKSLKTLIDITNTQYYNDDGSKDIDNDTNHAKAEKLIKDWKKRNADYSYPFIKSGEKVGGQEIADMNFFNVKAAYEDAYNAYIEAASAYSERYYTYRSSPLGSNATSANVQQMLADIIEENNYWISKSTLIDGPYDKYLNSIKYGIRLVYKLPSKKLFDKLGGVVGEKSHEHFIISDQVLQHFQDRAADSSHPSNYFGKAFKLREVNVKSNEIIEDLEKYLSDLWANPFKALDDPKSYIGSPKMDTFLTIPLIEIEKEVKDYFIEKNLPIANEDGLSAPKLSPTILENYPEAYLKNILRNSHELKVLLTEMMLYDELATFAGTFVSAYAMRSTFSGTNAGIFSGTKKYLEGALKGLAVQRDIEHSNTNKTPAEKARDSYSAVSNTKGDVESDFGPLTDFIGYAAIFVAKFPFKVLKGHVLASDPAIITAKKIQDSIVAGLQAAQSASNFVAGAAGGEAPDLGGAIDFASSNSALVPITLLLQPFPLGLNFALPITPPGIAFLGTAGIADALDSI